MVARKTMVKSEAPKQPQSSWQHLSLQTRPMMLTMFGTASSWNVHDTHLHTRRNQNHVEQSPRHPRRPHSLAHAGSGRHFAPGIFVAIGVIGVVALTVIRRK
jgi:hypothetical protein